MRVISPALISPARAAVPPSTSRPVGSAALAVALSVRTDLWEPLVRFREESRWPAPLEPDRLRPLLDPSLHAELDAAEVWLLSWLPGQGTLLHDHGCSSGAFVVARGTLTERVAAAGPSGVREVATDLAGGRLRYFGPHYVHQVTNRGSEPAVSLHVSTPPLAEMNTYEVLGDRVVPTGTRQAGVDS